MQVTDFEYRHQTLVHQLIVGAAFLTYLIQPDDIVWRLVKDRAEPQVLERLLFIIAAILIAFGAPVLIPGCTAISATRGLSANSSTQLGWDRWLLL